MSNIKHKSVSSHFQTPKRELKYNVQQSRVFLTNLKMFGNVMKHSQVFDIFSHRQSKLKLWRKQRNKMVMLLISFVLT